MLGAKIDAVYVSAEKTRKILKWSGIITIVVVVVPLLLIPLLVPAFFAAEGIDLTNLQALN